MPSFIVLLKDEATSEQVEATKERFRQQGCTVGQEYDIIKGFPVSCPGDAVTYLEADENVKTVEPDSTVTTQ